MGTSRGDFHKYPRTPHLVGSKGTADDKKLTQSQTTKMLADDSLIVEEKLDGTNVGLHFAGDDMILQCRGHEITAGMHPQYDLFKKWAATKQSMFEKMLGQRYVIYGEWMYARHSVHYLRLPHYFFEFDIFDKQEGVFLDLECRLKMMQGTGIHTVPVVHQGPASLEQLQSMIGPSAFDANFDNPLNGIQDDRMEGVYLRTESNGIVTARAKFVRPEFTEKVKQSTHWQQQKMVPNELADSADLWQ